jgi:hypothetical protein
MIGVTDFLGIEREIFKTSDMTATFKNGAEPFQFHIPCSPNRFAV